MIKIDSSCTGCGACYNICPTKAIAIEKDKLGFLYPSINKSLCINCNLCEKKCPVSNGNRYTKYDNVSVYLGCIKNENDLLNSSSGGAFSAIINSFFDEHGGVLYAASFNSEMKLTHQRYKLFQDDISASRKSKYTQSSLWNCYENILEDLKSEKVLVVGTPCQIAGLRSYLEKEYDNLLLVDLLCTGVCSPAFLDNHIKLLEKRRKTKVLSYDMRHKEKDRFGRWNIMEYSIRYSNNMIEKNRFYANMFRKLFGKHYYLRKSCYRCNFKSTDRCSDITIGDWWGEKYADAIPSDKGVSSIIINSLKAKQLIPQLSQYITLKKISLEEVIEQQPSLRYDVIEDCSPKMRNYSEKEFIRQLYLNSIPSFSELTKGILKKILPVSIAKRFLNK